MRDFNIRQNFKSKITIIFYNAEKIIFYNDLFFLNFRKGKLILNILFYKYFLGFVKSKFSRNRYY